MLDAMLWGLVQGLTEFLPISSSGHLVLVPAFLGVEPPDLATSALLHLGTLAAVLVYYRQDLVKLVHFRRDPEARHVLNLLIIGTIPATIGIVLERQLALFQESETAVAVALLVTGMVLVGSGFIVRKTRTLEQATATDAVLVGVAQATALLPGISRSGMTITASLARGLTGEQAARFSFLLAVPAIAGGAIIEAAQLTGNGGIPPELWMGVLVAAVSGYLAIAFLIRTLVRIGLRPFAVYCFVVGILALILL
ncbi:MAG TPA: undecaprenyl-diphosphate phosphatase [Acidimicrobiia bacterium]|jgi:undecaprenyl-diphosphatase|nr:undecaprenyl-diphosphate phosphatase [Acidimicrobiia bacterium]